MNMVMRDFSIVLAVWQIVSVLGLAFFFYCMVKLYRKLMKNLGAKAQSK
jgi:hypothetical protein